MDLITLAKLNALKSGGGVGYSEKKSITFNGDITGKAAAGPIEGDIDGFAADRYMVRIGDVIDVHNVESFTLFTTGTYEGEKNDALPDVTTIHSKSDSDFLVEAGQGIDVIAIGTESSSEAYIFSTHEEQSDPDGTVFPAGTYLWYARYEDGGLVVTQYVSQIEFSETIHQIDPKFIPGAVLPVVELSTVPTADGATLTAEESALMDEAAAMGVPIVANILLPYEEDTLQCSLCFGFNKIGDAYAFEAQTMLTRCIINNTSGAWFVMYSPSQGAV